MAAEGGRKTYLVPAGVCHAIDILLVRGTSAVYNAVAIAVAVVDAGAPFVRNIAVAV